MDYDAERNATEQPSLAEMTTAAITVLSKNPKGFYLMVEGRLCAFALQLRHPFTIDVCVDVC